MPGFGAINAYHNKVAEAIGQVLRVRVKILETPGQGTWKNCREGTEISFNLEWFDIVRSETARRIRGGRPTVPVFPLNNDLRESSGFWVSWHETWKKHSATDFALLTAGWTLFKGEAGIIEKDQILRVDWDQLKHRRSPQAGHPHWHFDHEIFSQVNELREEDEFIDLENAMATLDSEPGSNSMGFIHLAMGAWDSKKNNPECWQRTYEDQCKNLKDWCIKTLEYLQGQINLR